jgi:hypothetical protein
LVSGIVSSGFADATDPDDRPTLPSIYVDARAAIEADESGVRDRPVQFSGQFDLQSVPSVAVVDPVQAAGRELGTTSESIRWYAVTVGCICDESTAMGNGCGVVRPSGFEIEFELDTQFYVGLSQDVSDIGVFIATYREIPVGTLLGLFFELPCGTKIAAPGEVRWIRDTVNGGRPGLGVALTYLSDASLAAIRRFCEVHAPLFVEI